MVQTPACFYAYAEKVNSAAFISNPKGHGLYGKGPFLGKKGMIVLTTGDVLPHFTHGTGATSIDGLLFGTLWGSFYATGMSVLSTLMFCGFSTRKPDEKDDEIYAKFREDIQGLETRPVIDIAFKGNVGEHADDCEHFARLANVSPYGG
jgi:putative NADPH-quinone reductase